MRCNCFVDFQRGEGISSEPYRLYTLDVFRYDLDNPMGLYGAIPFLMSVNKEISSGIFALNPSETFVDITIEVWINYLEMIYC